MLSKLTTAMQTNKNLPQDKFFPQHTQAPQHTGQITAVHNCNTMKKAKLLKKPRTVLTTNATGREQPTFASVIPTSGLNQSIQ